jgi:hypothetical protein
MNYAIGDMDSAEGDRFFATQFDIFHLNTTVAKLRQNKD